MNIPLPYEITLGLGPEYTYLILLLLSIVGPLLLSFDKKVAFYKEWKYLAIPTLFASSAYIIWDIAFTKIGVWEFNRAYLLNYFIANLPLEEYGFFIVVPYASAFVFACLKAYFPNVPSTYNRQISLIVVIVSVILMSCAPFTWYTWTTFGLLIITIIYWQFIRPQQADMHYILLAWFICIIPMLYVNGVLTGKPVLIYNNAENLKIRIGSIPLEDFFYHLLYMVWMLNLYTQKKRFNLLKSNT